VTEAMARVRAEAGRPVARIVVRNRRCAKCVARLRHQRVRQRAETVAAHEQVGRRRAGDAPLAVRHGCVPFRRYPGRRCRCGTVRA